MISAIINKFGKKTVVIVSSISVGIIIVAVSIILLSTGASRTEEATGYQAIAQEYGVSENTAYLIDRTQHYNENANVEMLANMSITEIADNLRNEYVNVFQYKKIAQEYGISQDIAYIASKIVMIDSNADIEHLINLPITELVDTLREKLLQPQIPVAEEENFQGTEIAYADEAKDVDTEDADEAEDMDTEDTDEAEDMDTEDTDEAEDVDTENNDTDTPDSGTDSDDTNTEVPKPTQEPEEETQKEWSEWSEWMTNQDMWKIINSQYLDKEIQVDEQKPFYRNTIELVLKQRYREISLEWTDWQKVPDPQNTLNDLYPSYEYVMEEKLVDSVNYFRAGKITYVSDWSEWMPAPLDDKYYDKTKYDTEGQVDMDRSTFSPWRDTIVAGGYTDYDWKMLFERFRWR